MTVKKHTPSGAQNSTSARTKTTPPKGKAEGSKGAAAETPDKAAIAYAQTAYEAALAHYYANQGEPFALSRLAVVYGETNPGDFHMVVTLPGVLNEAVSEAEARDAVKDAELLARTLEHEGCPDAFKSAFGSIFTEHILSGSDVTYTTPAVVRVMLPLALLDRWRLHDGTGMTETEILVTLSSDLVDDEVGRDVRRGLVPGRV
jgi:hypothetical protein